MKKILLLSSLLVSLAANAQVTPKVQPETPVSGKQYVLVNKVQNPDQYMSRTGWDGALRFYGEAESNYAKHALTAVDNGDGTWSFTNPGTMTVETGEVDEGGKAITETVNVDYYLVLPEGKPNVNLNSVEPAKWILDPKAGNYYNLIMGEGNNSAAMETAAYTLTKDLRMHLNGGGEYFCITYYGGDYYPDVPGGIDTDNFDEETGNPIVVANDSTSFLWGFVQVDNVPTYYADLQYSKNINDFFEKYVDVEDEDYHDGFLATYNAVAAIYNGTDDPDELAEAGIVDIINAKVALYQEIEAAIALNEDDNVTLAAAIAAAKSAFNTKTAVTDVETATQTLKQAEKDYSMGTGDLTSLGTNMSFEDLSSQGNATTVVVAGPPAGWNVYINGQKIESASDVKGFNWHGINADAEGDPMDGNYAFGIWAQSIPTYELSQTIENLETGTYEISAGLMAGANNDGIRITTQRIFGNLNSTYFAGEEAYNKEYLDNAEVYEFAGNDPTITTDRTMFPVTVKAFVYDGTLTFGVRTDGNAAAALGSTGVAGSGWFKTDNFRIQSLGYSGEDAVAVYRHYTELLSEYTGEPMAAEVAEKLEDADIDKVTATSPKQEIVSSILEAKALFEEVNASVKAYEKLRNAIDSHYDSYEENEYKTGAADYMAVIEEAEDAYSDGTVKDEAAVDALIAKLDEALRECMMSEEFEEGQDLTEYIQNPSFEDLSAQNNVNSDGITNAPAGWSLYIEGNKVNSASDAGVAGWCAINSGDNIDVINTDGEQVTTQYTDGTHLWGLWSGSVPVLELSQTIKGLPAGTYTLSVDMVVENQWAGYNLGSQRIFANDYVAMFGAEEDYLQNTDPELTDDVFPDDVLIAAEIDKLTEEREVEYKHLTYTGKYSHESYGASSAPYTTPLTFGLAETGDLTFGFRTSAIVTRTDQTKGQASLGWFKLDNWKLTFESKEVPAGAETTALATAIDTIESTEKAEKATVEFYSINGIRLAAPQKGINIVKMSNGTVSKVLVK